MCGGGNGSGRKTASTPCAGALEQGAQAHGFEADLWTLERVGLVVERVTGVTLSRASVRRLLTGRLGWSPQRSERRGGAGRVRNRPLDRSRVATHQKGR
ncbi:helix-turn-helix domain-containing protein [Streptomyces wedmorensis]